MVLILDFRLIPEKILEPMGAETEVGIIELYSTGNSATAQHRFECDFARGVEPARGAPGKAKDQAERALAFSAIGTGLAPFVATSRKA